MKLRSDKTYDILGHPGPTGVRKLRPERPVRRTAGHQTRWPRRLAHTQPEPMINPLNYCYRRSLTQCLMHLPAVYSYLGSVHKDCALDVTKCTVCSLQTLMQRYWNEPQARAAAVQESLVRFDRAIHTDGLNSWFDDARTTEQGDPHEFSVFLQEQLREREAPGSTRLSELFDIHFLRTFTCEDCGGVDARPETSSGYDLNIQARSGKTLDQYLADAHQDRVPIVCNVDGGCANARMLALQVGQEPDFTAKDRVRDLTITQSPNVLRILLGRYGSGDGVKVRDNVQYPEVLNLSAYTADGSPLQYRLYGVVAHSGPSVDRGHYVAAVRKQQANEFATLDDAPSAAVTAATSQALMGVTSVRRRFDSVLLFYVKM